MTVRKINDAPVLDQLEGYWQKIAALLVWKFGQGKVVQILKDDIRQFAKMSEAGQAILFTHGRSDGFEFSIITEEAAKRIEEHEATQRGSA